MILRALDKDGVELGRLDVEGMRMVVHHDGFVNTEAVYVPIKHAGVLWNLSLATVDGVPIHDPPVLGRGRGDKVEVGYLVCSAPGSIKVVMRGNEAVMDIVERLREGPPAGSLADSCKAMADLNLAAADEIERLQGAALKKSPGGG